MIDTFNDKLDKILSRTCVDHKSKQETKHDLDIPTKHWCGNYKESENCCYRHLIGLPEKNGIKHPYYSYQESLEEAYNEFQLLLILKATGLGITEFFLTKAEHEALANPNFKNSQIIILTGPNRDLAKRHIGRIRNHFNEKIACEGDAYNVRVASCTISAFPAMNIHAARSLANPKLILVDEAAFFGMENDEEVRAVAERYIAKSDSKIVIFSTPFLPEGFFYNMWKEEPSAYKKIALPYEVGFQVHPESLTSIYSKEEIEKAKKSPSFRREYNLEWGFGAGDIFDLNALNDISKETYDLYPMANRAVLAIDPGYGSSKFAIVGAEKRDDKIYILLAEQYERASQSDMIAKVKSIMNIYNYDQILIDSANPGFIIEFPNAKGVSFKKYGQEMTDNAAAKVAKREVRIHPQFEELIRQLRAVQKNEKGTPDKKRLSFDLGDSFLIALHEFHHEFFGTILKDNWK